MDRRAVISAMGASALFGVSGCLDTEQDSTPQMKDRPLPPENRTTDSVVAFVEEYESATFYNEIRSTERTAESISVSCNAVLDRETDTGFYVLTRCGGSATLRDGTAEYPPTAYGLTTYRVTENDVQRVTASSLTAGDGYRLLLVNFDDSTHKLSVDMAPSSQSNDESIHSTSPQLGSEEAVGRRLETDGATEYELTVDLDTERQATFEGSTSGSPGLGIYVTATEIDIGPLPSIPGL